VPEMTLLPEKRLKYVWYKQAFSDEWLLDPELKDWAKPDSSI